MRAHEICRSDKGQSYVNPLPKVIIQVLMQRFHTALIRMFDRQGSKKKTAPPFGVLVKLANKAISFYLKNWLPRVFLNCFIHHKLLKIGAVYARKHPNMQHWEVVRFSIFPPPPPDLFMSRSGSGTECEYSLSLESCLVNIFIGSSVPGEDEHGSNRNVLLVTARTTPASYGQRIGQDERAHAKDAARTPPDSSTYYIVNKIFIEK